MRIIDRTGQSLGRAIARTRSINDIRRIAIHHSATTSGTTAIFENFWRTQASMGAPNAIGGYHEVILLNGDLELNYFPTQISHGVGGQNGDTYNICVVGDFARSQLGGAQLQVLLDRIRFNVNRFPNVNFDRVLGHREFPNQSTNCPPFNMSNIRNQARATDQRPPTPDPPNNNNNNNDTFIVTQATNGFNTAADAVNNRNRRTTVQPGTYHVFNRSQGMINVTRTRGVPGSWINPAGQATPPANLSTHTVRSGETLSGIAQLYRTTVAELQRLNNISNVNLIRVGQVLRLPTASNNTTTSNTIRVGSRVRVNSNARTWATGQNIPSWVRGQIHTVQQLRNSNREALLAGIISWIRVSDVTVL